MVPILLCQFFVPPCIAKKNGKVASHKNLQQASVAIESKSCDKTIVTVIMFTATLKQLTRAVCRICEENDAVSSSSEGRLKRCIG